MKKRYVLCPGWVRSANDGDRHWVTARQLASLYGVSLSECHVCTGTPADRHLQEDETLVFLYPSYSGNYTLPESPNA